MATWTDELKTQAIEAYQAGNPTAENSTELVKEIAEDLDMTANGVRQVLVQAKVYVKKEVSSEPTKPAGKTAGTKSTGEGTKRVSKESQLDELRAAIVAKGKDVDEDILGKLTGKAAAYFTSVLG
jgi:transposase-like protein